VVVALRCVLQRQLELPGWGRAWLLLRGRQGLHKGGGREEVAGVKENNYESDGILPDP